MPIVRLRNPKKDIMTQLKQCPALQAQGATWHMKTAVVQLVQQMAEKEIEANLDASKTRSR